MIKHRAKHRDAGNGFGYSIADLDQPTRTLTARYGKDGQEILISQDHTPLPRRLTPRECSRLMGMPDLVIPVSDSQAYRQLGHSVAPPLVEDLADFIMAQPLDPTGQNATSQGIPLDHTPAPTTPSWA